MMISLVVPVLNEEKTVPIFYREVQKSGLSDRFQVEIVFVNDGSKDATPDIVRSLAEQDPNVRLVDLRRNFGKEAALFAGLESARGDVVIPIDVDLQDPIDVIPEMIEKWQAGADMVLAKRGDRSSDAFLKRWTASAFYRLHNKISTLKLEENVGDFRLISRPTLNEILRLPERNLFMKGILSWVGGRTEVVEYKRAERVAGSTNFNGWKLWNLALEGITSFSTVPLRVWTYVGLTISSLAFLFGLWIIVDKLLFNNPVPGYPSLIVSVMFLGGIQILGIGILGEYIGRIYIEVKQRPRYLVRDDKEPVRADDGDDTSATVTRLHPVREKEAVKE